MAILSSSNQAAGNQAAPQPTVAANTANSAPPPFIAASTTVLPLGMSLFDCFPQIEASTILEITWHQFKPMDLFKLDPGAQDKNLEWKATLDMDGGVLTATPHW